MIPQRIEEWRTCDEARSALYNGSDGRGSGVTFSSIGRERLPESSGQSVAPPCNDGRGMADGYALTVSPEQVSPEEMPVEVARSRRPHVG